MGPLRTDCLVLSAAALFAASSFAGAGCSSSTVSSSSGSGTTGGGAWTGLTSSSASVGTGGATPTSSTTGTGGVGGATSSITSTSSTTGTSSTSSSSTSTTSSSSSTSTTSSSSSTSTTSSSSSNTTASSSSSTSSSSSGTVLLLAGSPTQLLTGEFHPGGTWTTGTLADGTSFGTSLTVDSAGNGVGVYTSSTGATVNATIWSAGTWSVPTLITASAVARAQPFVDATGGATAHVIFQDTSYKFNYLAHSASGWTTTPQSVGANYGPVPATIAALGANATAAFLDGQGPDTNYAAVTDLTGSTDTWAARADPGTLGNFDIPALIIPLSAGPDVMMVYVQCALLNCKTSATQITFLTRTAGTWTTPTAITNALTANLAALAPLPNGGAILAFRGTDTFLYWSLYSGGAWSAVAPFATPNVTVDTSPAITHGAGGDLAEIAYVSGGVAYHARLTGTTWAAPVQLGGTSVNGVAIASSP